MLRLKPACIVLYRVDASGAVTQHEVLKKGMIIALKNKRLIFNCIEKEQKQWSCFRFGIKGLSLLFPSGGCRSAISCYNSKSKGYESGPGKHGM
jgi:hypothetical protein